MNRFAKVLLGCLISLTAATLGYASVGASRRDCCGKSCPSPRSAPLQACCQAAPAQAGAVAPAPTAPDFRPVAALSIYAPPALHGCDFLLPLSPGHPPDSIAAIPSGLSPPSAVLG